MSDSQPPSRSSKPVRGQLQAGPRVEAGSAPREQCQSTKATHYFARTYVYRTSPPARRVRHSRAPSRATSQPLPHPIDHRVWPAPRPRTTTERNRTKPKRNRKEGALQGPATLNTCQSTSWPDRVPNTHIITMPAADHRHLMWHHTPRSFSS